ncbi:MAG: hypothetical protein HY579_07885, partial [Nitrospinae bacterium]|nr:hypothetical protein [Nitrospinota bacterium]
MKITNNTSMTSTNGVTLISDMKDRRRSSNGWVPLMLRLELAERLVKVYLAREIEPE